MPERIRRHRHPADRLRALVELLRAECPWDRAQTLESLRPYTLEEAHELLEAVERAAQEGDWEALKEELGDVLLHVVFYARLAEERGAFTLAEVMDGVVEKMIARHPHVFAGADYDPADWQSKKKPRRGLLDGIPPALPALKRAQELQRRAARVGFDWPDAWGALAKLDEEARELLDEVRRGAAPSRVEDELGDLLFTLVNVARKLGVDAELALMRGNRKFERRVRRMEEIARARGTTLDALSPEALERLWERAKWDTDEEGGAE